MEISIPHLGLIFWTIFSFIHVILCIVAIIKLANLPMDYRQKLLLLIGICIIPLFGPVVFFAFRKGRKSKLTTRNLKYKNAV